MKPETILCISSFFSACGDRMWSFAVGLYLIKLTPGSLQLSATYGLFLTAVSVLFAPVVGDWVDKNKRLKVIRITLVLQNVLVFICALFILLYLYGVTDNSIMLKLLQGVIILLGALANLAGQGEKIAISKDWIVVVCRGDSDLLAATNALLRRIDLSVAILAPVGVGFLMTFISNVAGIVLICSWNVLSVFGEYFLLLKVYKEVPELASKVIDGEYEDFDESNTDEDVQLVIPKQNKNNWNLIYRFKAVLLGWAVYRKQNVVLAGMALSMLYLTVLGFNAITTGYAYSQGLSELYVSICFGFGSLFGIGGTFLFRPIKKKIGLAKTGLCGFSIQLSMLMFCVVAIWAPGSPSEMLDHIKFPTTVKPTTLFPLTTLPIITTITPTSISNISSVTNRFNQSVTNLNGSTIKPTAIPSSKKFFSIIMLMVGIILSRAGLWIIDLTITQLQQENVPEVERGVVGGVQYSLNSVLDLLHFIVTIIIPKPEQFGYLVLMSVGAVVVAYIIYVIFCVRFLNSKKNETTGLIS